MVDMFKYKLSRKKTYLTFSLKTEGETVKRSAPRSAYGYRTQKSDKGSVKDIFVETVNLGKDATPTRYLFFLE